MARTLGVKCTQNYNCFKSAGTGESKRASDRIAMGVLRVFCKLSLLVSPGNHSELSIDVLEDMDSQSFKLILVLWELNVWKSAKAKVDKLWTTQFLQLLQPKDI